MWREVTKSMFIQLFKDFGRESNFTYDALSALYDYLDDVTDYVVDIIAICCEFSEYQSLDQFNKDYSLSCESVEDIEKYTFVLPFQSGFLIQSF